MRICVFALAVVAVAQPAFAGSHSHGTAHQAAHHHARHAHHVAYARVRAARVHAVHNGALDAMIARHAAANGLPVALVQRVVKRESGYNARASHGGNLGLMQIRYTTARGVGYSGSAAGLLDPEVNLTYAVKYLAGAWRAAGGNASRAVSLYASGYRGRSIAVARRAPAPADAWGWQAAPVGMRTDAWRGMM